MTLVLDHCFVLTAPGASDAASLVAGGLVEGPGSRHPGQGSANRRFFLANGMLEFLWVQDPDEARAGPGRDLRLAERACGDGASPFGLILRAEAPTDATPPFDGWAYQPDYFEPPRAFHVGANAADLSEPLCIFAPFPLPPPAVGRDDTNPAIRIERVRLATPAAPGSDVLAKLGAVAGLEILSGEAHLLEITLAGDGPAHSLDLRPAIPLILRRSVDAEPPAGSGESP